MAAELRLNVKEAKRAGLLHDIGKAIDHKVEGTHAGIGADYAKRFGEPERIVQAIATHHDDGRNNTLLGVLVQAADTLSAARPGARREMLETYVKRLEELEGIAKSFNGVEKCFAIQAGREIRILVENEKISDNDSVMLCQGHRQEDRVRVDLSGTDQGHRHPGNQGDGFREIRRALCRFFLSETSWASRGAGPSGSFFPGLLKEHGVDLVIANGENAAAGFGITRDIVEELLECGIDLLTTGNHVWDKKRGPGLYRRVRTCCGRPISPRPAPGSVMPW